MKRRNFIKASTIGSACVLSGTLFPINAEDNKPEAEYYCKITVLKKTLNKEWNMAFRNIEGSICDKFSEGQEFIIESPWEMPKGFCSWAWADIRTLIHLVNDGKFDTFVSCCTDGFRPVFFKIDRVKK